MTNQILNNSYKCPLSSENLNKILYNLFNPGVINGTFSFTPTIVTISELSFLIYPQNKPDILVRIDTTEEFSLTKNSSTDNLLIARYRFENENQGAEFLFVDSTTKLENDIILVGLVLDSDGNIVELDEDLQNRPGIKLIDKDTVFPLVRTLDGYAPGNSADQIPINNGILNENLNAQYVNGKEIEDLVVSKELPTTSNSNGVDIITYPELPSWMDSQKVDEGDGVTSEFLQSQKIQPQDGITAPGNNNQIAVATGVLQINLNSQYLNGKLEGEFTKTNHSHALDDINDGGTLPTPIYYKILGIKSNMVSEDSIEINDIGYSKLSKYAYDQTMNINYTPIYETGTVTLSGLTPQTITFSRTMRNARVFLQPIYPSAGMTNGYEKRICRISSLSTTSVVVTQMAATKLSTANYVRDNTIDTVSRVYHYFIIGEKL